MVSSSVAPVRWRSLRQNAPTRLGGQHAGAATRHVLGGHNQGAGVLWQQKMSPPITEVGILLLRLFRSLAGAPRRFYGTPPPVPRNAFCARGCSSFSRACRTRELLRDIQLR